MCAEGVHYCNCFWFQHVFMQTHYGETNNNKIKIELHFNTKNKGMPCHAMHIENIAAVMPCYSVSITFCLMA